ncbi:MAG: hypothetical protein ACI4J4_10125 [Ruminiclostridium sp.]
MKKVLSVFLIAFILTAAGCGGNNPQETTENTTASTEETSGGSTNKVTQVAYQSPEEDTTEEALALLEKEVPLFADYLKIRMNTPVTVEATVTVEDGSVIKSGIYIKDSLNAALISEAEGGSVSRVVYAGNMAYQIDEKEKIVYYMEKTEESVKEIIGSYLLKINLSDVEKCSFVQDYEDFEGVTYKHEIIYDANANPGNYYFDENTNEIRYIRIGEDVTRFDKVESAVSDESVFEIPSDYKQVSYEELLEKLREEQEKQAAQTEQSAAE